MASRREPETMDLTALILVKVQRSITVLQPTISMMALKPMPDRVSYIVQHVTIRNTVSARQAQPPSACVTQQKIIIMAFLAVQVPR